MLDKYEGVVLKWGDSFDLLNDSRKQELRQRLESWDPTQATNKQVGPFAGEHLNGLEVFWLAACALAGNEGDPASVATKELSDPHPGITPVRLISSLVLAGADLSGAHLEWACLWGADLSQVNLSRADLWRANLWQANLSRANMPYARVQRADLRGANLSDARLQRAHLQETNLRQANLSHANILGSDLERANVSGATLSEANLSQALLVNTNLQFADLSRANLSNASLWGAQLTGVNLSQASLWRADLSDAILLRANLLQTDLSEARLIRTDLSSASLEGCLVYGASVWDPQLAGTIQSDLQITPREEPKVTVDDLEVAQFLYLVLHNDRLRKVIDTIAGKVVLILGRFTLERKPVLDALREMLRGRGYAPILFDFDRPTTKNTTETISLLARMARFIIADLTEPRSIPHELALIVPHIPVPVQPLLLEGESTYGMNQDLLMYPWMLPTRTYTTIDGLISGLSEQVIAPAEAKAEELQRQRILHAGDL